MGQAAAVLGNTNTICRKSHVHPAVIEAYSAGRVIGSTARRRRGLLPEESALLTFLMLLREKR